MSLRIAPAVESDVPVILSFIRKLADYEKLSHLVIATEENIRRTCSVLIPWRKCCWLIGTNSPWASRSTFAISPRSSARPGIYLEDLFVDPGQRGKGIGKALLARLAKIAVERGYGRLEWAVLDWNTPSIEFYRSLGAVPLNEWTGYRLTGAALARLSGERPPAP